MPKSRAVTPSGSSRAGEPADDLAAEAVVAQEDVADAGDERPGHRPASAAAGTGSRNSSGGSRSSGRPRDGGRSRGSSGSVTATWTSSSTVSKMASTVARRPRRKKSNASARRVGCRRTTEPFDTADTVDEDRRELGRHACLGLPDGHWERAVEAGSSRSGTRARRACARRVAVHLVIAARRAQVPDRAVEPIESSGGIDVRGVDDRAGAQVGRPRGGLLLVRQGHDPQGQDLVDLGPVEQVALALRGDGRVVVQDDRRAQHEVPPAFLSRKHRPCVVVVAAAHDVLVPRDRRPDR